MASHTIIDFFSLESAIATEFRRLLHSLQTLGKEREMKAVMVTSSMLSEGKSTVASFLALTAARKGMKTLLIDADLRRPTLHRLFNMTRDPGLTDILLQSVTVKDAVRKTPLEKLDVIPAGRAHAHPSEVFDAPAVGRIAQEMKFYYDLVVIDCAPVLPVSDPMLLSQEVDGVLFVIKAGETQRDVVQRASSILHASTNKMLGVILNNADGSLPYYYNHDYYGYDYKVQTSSPKGSRKPDSTAKPLGASSPGSKVPKPKDSLSR